jgi:general secretion pathway protein K
MTSPLRDEKGMVLLLVLVIVALLAALLTEFAFSTLVDLRLTETFRDNTRAYYYAKSGITAGRMLLKLDQPSYDAHDEMWAQPYPNVPVGDGVVSLAIEDQGGKLDIKTLLTGRNVNPIVRDQFKLLFTNLELDNPSVLTAALIDWIDGDEDPHEDIGAESDYYSRQTPPYRCKNALLDSLGELTLIRGFTPEIIKLVTPHLTVHGNDDKKINVNTASIDVLMSLSEDPVIDRSTAEAIIAMRQDKPFKTVMDLKKLNDLPGLESLLTVSGPENNPIQSGPFGVTSSTYRIESEGGVGDGVRRIEAFVKKDGDKLLYIKVN